MVTDLVCFQAKCSNNGYNQSSYNLNFNSKMTEEIEAHVLKKYEII